MILLFPSPVIKDIHVLVYIFCQILFAKISPKRLYVSVITLLVIPVAIIEVLFVIGFVHKRFHVNLVVSDQIYFVESKVHERIRSAHEYMTG